MNSSRNKRRALLLDSGAFSALPLVSSLWNACPNSPGSECYGMCHLASVLFAGIRIAVAVEANVRWSMTKLATIPEHKKALADGKVALVGAVYELETGKVRVLD